MSNYLNDKDQELLNKILAKEVFELTAYEKAVLNGRVSYLKKEDIVKFKSVLNTPGKPEEKKEPKKPEKKESKLSYRELLKKAASLGIRTVGMKKEQIIAEIAKFE